MKFDLSDSLDILERTPIILENLLSHLALEWVVSNEGENTWSPFDVLGHLVHGERVDWPQRIKKILDHSLDRHFEPFDRFAQFQESQGKSLQDLLDEFAKLRQENLELVNALNITETELSKTGVHPSFGEVTLQQLLATWVVHDLNHISQILRVMGKQYAVETGPWRENLRLIKN
ncbi:MAG: DinB family protein [Bacteroidota bacterium]